MEGFFVLISLIFSWWPAGVNNRLTIDKIRLTIRGGASILPVENQVEVVLMQQEVKVVNKRNKTKDIALCGLFVALITVCSWISIPLTVPVTMQTFAIFLCAGLLGTKRGLIVTLCWIIMGTIGVPVFANFQGGPQVIMGPLGGYIVGFVITVLIVGITCDKVGRKPVVMGAAMFVGLVLCYAIGTVWFMYMYAKSAGAISLGATLSMCIFPFVIPDVAKLVIAVILTKRLERFV